MSFPTRERGLKFSICLSNFCSTIVVPHAGTWIEIRQFPPLLYLVVSFPTRERGLKSHDVSTIRFIGRRSPRGNVD